MKNISYAEYRDRMKKITSPEEAAAFAQELLTPMLAGLPRSPAPVAEEEELAEESDTPKRQGKRPTVIELVSRQVPYSFQQQILQNLSQFDSCTPAYRYSY